MINNPTTGTLTSNVVAGALVAILVWIIGLPQFGAIVVPGPVEVAMTVVVGWLLSFAVHNQPDAQVASPATKGFCLRSAAFVMVALGLIFALANCTANGGFASFSSTAPADKKVDWATTVKNTCIGVKASIAVVDAVYTGDPKIFGNDANAQVYASVKALMLDTCGTTPPADLQTAEANLLLASADVGKLITTLKTNGVIK